MQRLAETRQETQQRSPRGSPKLLGDHNIQGNILKQDEEIDKRNDNNNRIEQRLEPPEDAINFEGFRRISPENITNHDKIFNQDKRLSIMPPSIKIAIPTEINLASQRRLTDLAITSAGNNRELYLQRTKKLREPYDSDSKMDTTDQNSEIGEDYDRHSDVSEELNVDEVTDDVLSPVDLTRRQMTTKHYPFVPQAGLFLPKTDNIAGMSIFDSQHDHFAFGSNQDYNNKISFKSDGMEKSHHDEDRQNGPESICSDLSRHSHSPKPGSPRSPSVSLNHNRRLAFSVENILDPNKFTGRHGEIGPVLGAGRDAGLRLGGGMAPAYWRPHFDVLERDGSESGMQTN